jgi:glycosyltransferase involved in cell wall biosynthesis
VPVIASHGGSLAEVVQDAGIIVDPFDSEAIAIGVRRLMEDREFRSDLIVRGHSQAASFRWEESGRKVLEAFKGIVGR